MISIKMTEHSIRMVGHAGTRSESGADRACAAVSALTCNLVNSLHDLTQDKAQRKPCRSTKVCGSDLHRPYGTGDTVPKWHTAGCSNTWHGHRFRSDRAVHTVRQKAVLRTQKAVQMVRTHEEPAQGQHPEGGG